MPGLHKYGYTLLVLVWILCAQAQQGIDTPPPAERQNTIVTNISPSGQFHVSGQNSQLTSSICSTAEEIRSTLFKILKLNPKDWRHPIQIRLIHNAAQPGQNPIRTQISVFENAPIFTVLIHTGQGIAHDQFRHAIISILLYEMTLRHMNMSGLPDRIALPDWLVTGLEQALLWRNNQADRNMYATLFRQADIMSPLEIVHCKNPSRTLDAASLVIYQVSCGAFVQCLLRQENGEEGITQLLNQAILGNDSPENLLTRTFPQFNLTQASLHKWWALQLSRMATPPLTETFTIQETERQLQEALSLVHYDTDTRTSAVFPLDDTEQAYTLPDLNRQLNTVSTNLVLLLSRAFPSYRPIIIEYAKLVVLMQTGSITSQQAAPKIQHLREIRLLSSSVALRARDYMDWYEINTRTGTGQSFNSYIHAVQRLRTENIASNTPIARYLQDIERLFILPPKTPVPAFITEQNHQ